MKFRTEVEVPISKYPISHQDQMLIMGSCFSENIGNRLLNLKFRVDLNPFGVIFNPASIAQGMNLLLDDKPYPDQDLFFDHDCWNSFMHHSRFSKATKDDTLESVNNRLSISREQLSKTRWVLFTFGTAWVYRHVEKNMIVANCHRLPASVFERKLLKVDEIVAEYRKLMMNLHVVNPEMKFLYTISPVRHLKDGANENQISKSILQLAVHELLKEKQTAYFPAYEIMLDELRDYRFYNEDMVHPSEMAVNYIFEKFSQAYFSTSTSDLNAEIFEISKACQHQPVNPESVSHQKFVHASLKKIAEIEKRFPFLDFNGEKRLFSGNQV